ncbi:unnamed protein product [Effrenium voratum]|nr:unnamed protein product [Effrenium voratum]
MPVPPGFELGRGTEWQMASQAFQAVVDKVVQQHVLELAKVEHQTHMMLQAFAEKERQQSPERFEAPVLEKKDRHRSADRLEVGHVRSVASVRSNKSDSGESKESMSLAKKFQRRCIEARRSPRHIEASDILGQIDASDNDVVKFFKSPDATVQEFFAMEKEVASASNRATSTQQSAWSKEYAQLPTYAKLQAWLQSHRFDLVITLLLGLNVIWMACELQIAGTYTGLEVGVLSSSLVPTDYRDAVSHFFEVGDVVFTCCFTLDVAARVIILRTKFWRVCMNYIDFVVTIASMVEIIITTPVNPFLFRLLRIGKLSRALRLVTLSNTLQSLELLTKCLMASVDMLFWTFCLLACVQCVAGMLVSGLCREFIEDSSQVLELREEVFRYYGTFTRTFLTMFEILFANWGPPCRVVVENISEWFSMFFLLYRCVVGFALLNVVNAVFVQQTMKTASSDEELAFKQKERDVAMYTRKVKKLFQSMDEGGDGALNLQEFAKLANSPKLKFWMSQLELEYHDLLSLFEFLDNGDGQITLTEFIEGAARLRGSAKAIDVWRLETKMEVLMGEVLSLVRDENAGVSSTMTPVQRVFEHSLFNHIHSIAKQRTSGRISPQDADEEIALLGQSVTLGTEASNIVSTDVDQPQGSEAGACFRGFVGAHGGYLWVGHQWDCLDPLKLLQQIRTFWPGPCCIAFRLKATAFAQSELSLGKAGVHAVV